MQLATDEAAIVNNREIPDISYPGIFQPFGGFADGIAVEGSYVKLPEIPGVGFEAKGEMFRVMKALTDS